jgi:hypothetical protein
MRPRTLVIIGAVLVFLYIAALPLGEIFVAVGNLTTSLGHGLEHLNLASKVSGH